ncbi:MAG: HAD hydrolase-like protein, partial [Defluviitaleaceae bacterium]|nr:HAD hydrolase-like protein [Defluviitaleaceae bacterium]
SREYFDHVLARIPPVKKDKILMVGDSLTADVAGGNGAGIDSCWFNLRSIKNQTNIAPTYEIRKLRELERFV